MTKISAIDNDPFARFGITHLSATSLIQFRNDPALGVVYLILKVREIGSPAMHRGTAIDEAIGLLLTDDSRFKSLEEIKRFATQNYRRLIKEDPETYNSRYVEHELRVLLNCLDVCFPLMKSWDKPTAYQKEICINITGIEIPIRGYIDLLYPYEVRELKSTVKPKREIIPDHAFQVSTYALAIQNETGEWPEACVDYLTPTALQSYTLDDVESQAQEVINEAFAIRSLLSKAKDHTTLSAMITPDFKKSIWKYRPQSKRAAIDFFATKK